MFVIYKYTNDPSMLCKSAKYTGDEFVQCRDLLPKEEERLFETSVLVQLKAQEAAQAAKNAELKRQSEVNPFLGGLDDNSDEMSKILEAIVLANQQP